MTYLVIIDFYLLSGAELTVRMETNSYTTDNPPQKANYNFCYILFETIFYKLEKANKY